MKSLLASARPGRPPLILFACLVVSLLAVSAGAEESVLESRRSMDYDKIPMQMVLKTMFFHSDIAYRVEGGPEHEFNRRLLSFCADDVRFRIVLDAICDSVGCEWSMNGKEILFRPVPRQGPVGEVERDPSEVERLLDEIVELHLGGAKAADVLKALEMMIGAPIDAPEELKALKVSMDLSSRPKREVLDEICRQLECRWQVEITDGRARIVLVR